MKNESKKLKNNQKIIFIFILAALGVALLLFGAYGKNEEVEETLERLFSMYLSNYSKSYYYGAIIDHPDSVCYRTCGDVEREEKARKCAERLNRECEGRFFCALRQSRFTAADDSARYLCEGGALGALKSLWRYLAGRKNEVFPIYGCVPKSKNEISRVYYSS